jgi:hypothetical protein
MGYKGACDCNTFVIHLRRKVGAPMKILIALTVFALLTACGKGGATNGAAATVPVDSSPHVYVVTFIVSGTPDSGVMVHQICNFGRAANFRDETTSWVVQSIPGARVAAMTCATTR